MTRLQLEAPAVDDLLKRVRSDTGVEVEGVLFRYCIDVERLEPHRGVIQDWINQLDPAFHRQGGGGWSFLNLCHTADGRLWTGEHLVMEAFTVLCMALQLARYPLPRDLWSSLPGGMPYVQFDAER